MKIKQLLIKSISLLCFVSLSVSASWQEAAGQVEQSLEQMLAKAAVYKGEVDGNLEPLYKELDEITNDKVDYEYISKIVMGKYYRQASEPQKVEFEKVFKRTLLKTYGKTLVSFNVTNYELIEPRSESPQADKQQVVVKVSSDDGQTYSLVSYMVKADGKWKLVNIVLDGFNLRVTFKNQFAELADQNRGNVAKAIDAWADIMSKK
jgi:phospholipid transport system substrate-binding protein